MQINDIAGKVNSLASAWEQFKSVNDRRLSEIERKGSADPLTNDQLSKINLAIDNYSQRLGMVETVLSRPTKSAEFGLITSPNAREHKEAFCNYLRKGVEGELPALEKKALSVASDPDGGYLVTATMSDNIVKAILEISPVRQIAAVETISSDALEIIDDKDEAIAGWTTETGSISETASPQIGKKNIPTNEMYAQPKATQKLIDDASIDIEAWLAGKISETFARREGTAFVAGDGVGKPRGFLTYAAGTAWGQIQQINSGSSGNITADSLINLYYSLKDVYTANATFLMNRASVQAVRLLKEATTNQYLWQPGLTLGAPDTLLGVPVKTAPDMPTPAAGTLSVALGDFKRGYQIVDRNGIRILRDPFTEKPFVKFYTTRRVGGDVVNFEAIKLLKLS